MDNGGHLLALKVMRVSRPSLLGQWQPFSSSALFDAYAQSSLTSMQQSPPYTDQHPSTVHDFNALSPLLSLPSSFGTISLGETFVSILSLTNLTNSIIDGVSIHVSLHTTSTKTVLLETPLLTLNPTVPTPSPLTNPPSSPDLNNPTNGSSTILEAMVSAEIKELGQHTLTCVVTYRVPAHIRAPQASDDPSDPRKMIFRKHYRFPVTNPFNVKTKVHIPKSPSMLMDRQEREKVFLEIHVQNLTNESIWFEKLDFKPVDGWLASDGNLLDYSDAKDGNTTIIKETSRSKPLLQSQDTYQYVYILTPSTIPSFPSKPAPGTIIPLGRLDMGWRSTLGEPGRLLTSMLSRRIPPAAAPPVPAALPALPPHVQRAIAAIPRPRSPTPSISSITSSSSFNTAVPSSAASATSGSRPSSPVPYKSRQPNPNRPQTPVQSHPSITLPPVVPTVVATDIQVDLVVDHIDQEGAIALDDPFSITFTATIAAFSTASRRRTINLGVQHVIQSRRASSSPIQSRTANANTNALKHTASHSAVSHSPTPSAMSTPRIQSIDFAAPFVDSPRTHRPNPAIPSNNIISLPSPYLDESEQSAADITPIGTGVVEFLGESFVRLPPFTVMSDSPMVEPGISSQPAASAISPLPTSATAVIEKQGSNMTAERKRIASHQFKLNFIPVKMGLANVGGVRLLLLSDTEEDTDSVTPSAEHPLSAVQSKRESTTLSRGQTARILQEWPTVAEVWVEGV